ncbi:MAG: trypsin-like serine protease [Actinomycetota bacterium]
MENSHRPSTGPRRRSSTITAALIVAVLGALVVPVAATAPELAITAIQATSADSVEFSVAPETEILDPVVEYREVETGAAWLADGDLTTQVVGGHRIAIDDHRYTVKLFIHDGPYVVSECGGVVIDASWILTAAHCVEIRRGMTSHAPADSIAVVYGVADWQDYALDRNSSLVMAESIVQHPDWDRSTLANDIALVRVAEPFDPATARAIPLFDLAGPHDTETGYVTGWGAIASGGRTVDDLRGVEVAIDDACGIWPEQFADWDPELRMCAGAPAAGFCQGDSGGPLVVNRSGVLMVAGIVSFNSNLGCAIHEDLPDVYTRVSAHVDWVESVTGPLWSTASLADGGGAELADARPGRTYAVRIGDLSTGAATVETVTMPGRLLRGPAETGVDCDRPDAHPFVDVNPDSFGADAIACVFHLGVTTGTSSTTFDPAAAVTREQMSAFVARFRSVVTGELCLGGHDFVDVDPSSYADGAVGCLAVLGITSGTSPTTFSPDLVVTREQMAAFLARLYRELTGETCAIDTTFADVSPTSYARADIGCLAELGVTTGTSSTTYSPAAAVTREQMATFLARLYGALSA